MAVSRGRVWRSRQPRDAHRLFWVTVPSPNGELGTQVLVVSVRLGTPAGFSQVPWKDSFLGSRGGEQGCSWLEYLWILD